MSPAMRTVHPRQSGLHAQQPRLSDDEQYHLLHQAIEARRLRTLRQEQQSGGSTQLLTLSLAQQAGYGDDLQAYRTALESGIDARETLVSRNMGLVHYCVKEIVGKRKLQTLSKEDLVQEGAIGLARAVDKWNPAIGGKFSTYAVYWIRAAVLRCIAERDDIIRVPEHVSAAIRKVSRAATSLGLDIDGDSLISTVYSSQASWKEALDAKKLAEEAGLTEDQLGRAIEVRNRRKQRVQSFEAWMQRGNDYESDLVPSSQQTHASSVDHSALKAKLSQFLGPKEMEALTLRYGLGAKSPRDYVAEAEIEIFGDGKNEKGRWGEAMSFKEIGRTMQISSEYGRKLCHAALKKLQRAAEDGALEPHSLSFQV